MISGVILLAYLQLHAQKRTQTAREEVFPSECCLSGGGSPSPPKKDQESFQPQLNEALLILGAEQRGDTVQLPQSSIHQWGPRPRGAPGDGLVRGGGGNALQQQLVCLTRRNFGKYLERRGERTETSHTDCSQPHRIPQNISTAVRRGWTPFYKNLSFLFFSPVLFFSGP